MGALSDPRWQRAWAVGNGSFAAAFAGADWLARDTGWGSVLAPSHGVLLLSIAFGCGLGLAGLVATWRMPAPQREHLAAMARLPVRERFRWRHSRLSLRYSGWFLLLMYGLLGWCWFNDVFVLPAFAAATAVMFAALPPWAMPPGTAAEHSAS